MLDTVPSRREFLGKNAHVGGVIVASIALQSMFGRQSRALFAQENNEQNPLYEKSPGTFSLLVRSRWVDIGVSLGQLQVLCIESAQSRKITAKEEENGLYEELRIIGDTDIPTVHYRAHDAQKTITVDVINGKSVDVRQIPDHEDVVPVTFTQKPSGTVLLRTGKGDDMEECSEKNMWHILLRKPSLCNRHLMPLLSLMIGSNHVMQDAAQVEEGLLHKAGEPHLSIAEMKRLVFILGTPDHSAKRQASRQLYAMGIRALPYLESLKVSTMSRDQSKGVSDVLLSIREKYIKNLDITSSKDSVQRTILWLYEDPVVWSIFLKRADTAERAIAMRELQAMYPDKTARELMTEYGSR